MRWLRRFAIRMQIKALEKAMPTVEERIRLAGEQGWRPDELRHKATLAYYRSRVEDLRLTHANLM